MLEHPDWMHACGILLLLWWHDLSVSWLRFPTKHKNRMACLWYSYRCDEMIWMQRLLIGSLFTQHQKRQAIIGAAPLTMVILCTAIQQRLHTNLVNIASLSNQRSIIFRVSEVWGSRDSSWTNLQLTDLQIHLLKKVSSGWSSAVARWVTSLELICMSRTGMGIILDYQKSQFWYTDATAGAVVRSSYDFVTILCQALLILHVGNIFGVLNLDCLPLAFEV